MAQGASELMADTDSRRTGSVNIVNPAQLPSSPRGAPRPASATMERAALSLCECGSELPAHRTPDVEESVAGNPKEAMQAAAHVDCHAVELFAESCGSHGDVLSETLRDRECFLGTVDRDEEEERGRVRTGLASSMPLRPAVDDAVAAMVRRYEPRMPRHRLLAPLQRFVSALRSDLPAEEPTEADVALPGSPGEEAPADPVLAALQAHHIEGSLSVMAAMHDAVDSTVKAIKQEGDRLWSASGEAHARDLASVRRHAQDFVVATIALTACAQRSYFSMALSLVVPDAFCHVENMHVRLYRHLRLPPSQKLELAHLFTDWVANRRLLTHRQTDAMLPLSIWSPHAGDGPLDFSTVVAACAGGVPAFRLRKLPESARVLHRPVAGRLVPVLQGAGSRDTAETLPLRRFYAEDGRLLLDSPAAWVMSKEMAAAAPGLVGQCSVATIAAAETLRRLRSVHDLTCNLYQDLQSQLMPGAALTVQQVMRCMWCPVLHGVGPPDIVLLCQLAHQQQRRDETFAGIEALAV
eukprot:jgi/Ulvmu1/6795/UM306_0002.1